MDPHQQEFLKLLNQMSDRHSNVFGDFAEAAALSFSNSFWHGPEWQAREDRYLQLAKQYGKDFTNLTRMLVEVVLSLETRMHDCLGHLYMSDKVRARSRWDSDVCFTPWHIGQFMAKVQFTDFRLPEKGFIRLAEPACGAGCLVLAAAAELKNLGLNFQQVLHATCVDIRAELVHLCYLQLSLLHIPAVVIHGDSLSGHEWSRWRTPAHILGGWERRCPVSIALPVLAVGPAPERKPQLTLF
jgi:type I restriction-modification system DNA methylase subunit